MIPSLAQNLYSHSSDPNLSESVIHSSTVPSTPIVRFAGVQKTYDGGSLVVKDLNLSIRRGEFLTLLGPSGSGKTTTLMMLAGFELPTHGEIYLDEMPISKQPPHRRGIGMVFQSYALFPHMSIAQNLAFPLEVRRLPKSEIKERVERALKMVELGSLGARSPNQLSGGQQQRIALARALVFEPRLVLMDEPLGALDKQLREQMQYELKQLHERIGVTIVYVTHDQSEALTMSDRIAVFRDGTIEQLATPSELYERPQTPYVAQFIGENNQLIGKVDHMLNAERCIVSLAGGSMIVSASAHAMQSGEQCLLSVRPERIAVGKFAMCDNQFESHVEDVIYLGDHLRIQCRINGTRLVAKVANTKETATLRRGQTIALGWHAQDCQVFPHLQHTDQAIGE